MATKMAMSTGWNAERHVDARGIIQEIQGFGIDRIEAGYSLSPVQLQEMVEILPRMGVKVTSVHNFCPIPSDHKCNWGDDFLLSSPDEECRRRGVEATLETLKWAERLGAKVIVLHLGSVEMDRGPYERVKRLTVEGSTDGNARAAAIKELKNERARLAGPHLEAIRRTIHDVAGKLPHGITLGFETRYQYFTIPNLPEMVRLLEEFGEVAGYWHDIGHANAQETMGLYEKGAYLETLRHKLIGFHIHDALGISDHRPPGAGELDLEGILRPYLDRDCLKVLEFHPRVTPEEAARGIANLRAQGLM